jgi:periplasmic protein TonB
MKKHILTLLCNLILVSCTDIVNDVPLQNVLEHRNYLSSKSGEEADLFKSYKNIFDNNASTNSKPYIYYYLARVENNKIYLNLGLSKFPDDPYLNLTKKKYFNSSFKEENLNKDVLSKHPKFGLALYNLIESKRYSYLFSGKTITDSFFKENIDNIKELKDLFDGYFNGENNSVHYDFNDINKYGDPEVDSFLKEKYLIMETLYERLKNEYKIPNYFLNKKIHTSSKWCEDYILISDNMEFKIVNYTSRILYVRDSLVIEGKFLPTGKIEFKNKNSKFLNNGVQNTMLPEYNIYKNLEPSLSQINLSFELIDGKGQTEDILERKIRNHRFSQSTYMLQFSPCEEQKPNNGRKLDKYGEWVYVSDVGNTQHPISTTPPPPTPEKIELVEDEEEIEETVIESTETDETEAVEVEDIVDEAEEEEVIEDIPFTIIEDVPVFPGCKGNKKELKACFNIKMQKHFGTKFNADLPNGLGMTPGKKRIIMLFKINKVGDIVDIRAKAPHPKLQKEAIRIIKLLPKMKPGRQRGKAVGVKYTLPMRIEVE